MTPFLTLEALVLPPPLPAIVSLLLVGGMAGWAEWGMRLCHVEVDMVRRSAAFSVVVAVCGAVVHALAMTHLSSLVLLRVLAVIVAFGALRVWPLIRDIRGPWFIVVVIGCLALAALGPVTDADSLDYHLGVPLDWLRHGGVVYEPHWLHARIVGLGEAVNMLGLAAGTDGVGAVLQVSGVVILTAVLASLGKTPQDRALAMMLALPPAILPLAISQKPQLMPLAALVTATVLARQARGRLDLMLVFGCAAFAMASKFSFFVAGAVVMIAALWWTSRKREAFAWAAIALAVLLLPILWRNYSLYGDPLSPFLESLKSRPDGEVLRFADYLRDAGEPHTVNGLSRFLAGLLAPHGFSDIQTVLGLGIFCIALIGMSEWTWFAVAGGSAVLVFTVWRGQLAPRYLLEAYFWFAIMVVARPWTRWKSALFYGLAVQTAGVAVMALVGVVLLFPGALSAKLRDQVMMRATYGYAEAKWIDRVLPKNSTIMVESRAYALLPRPFVIPECATCGSVPIFSSLMREDLVKQPAIVMNAPADIGSIDGCVWQPIAGPEPLVNATRNPFNRSEYSVVAMSPKCQ